MWNTCDIEDLSNILVGYVEYRIYFDDERGACYERKYDYAQECSFVTAKVNPIMF